MATLVDSFAKPKRGRKSKTSDSLGRSRMVAVFGMRRRRGRFGGRSFARFAAQSIETSSTKLPAVMNHLPATNLGSFTLPQDYEFPKARL